MYIGQGCSRINCGGGGGGSGAAVEFFDKASSSPFSIPVVRQCVNGSAKPRHRLAYQWLDNVKMYKYAKFDSNIRTMWFKSYEHFH